MFYQELEKNLNLTRDEFYSLIVSLYDSPMSSLEIVEYFYSDLDIDITSRSIQRILNASGTSIRSNKDSFNLAIKKGRVKYQKSEYKPTKRKRFTFNQKLIIFRARDWKCALCPYQNPNDYDFSTLVLDHVIPLTLGGTEDESNLQILCTECHEVKTSKEHQARKKKTRGGAVSGRSLEIRLATR